jgi:serine/threonine protein kinase
MLDEIREPFARRGIALSDCLGEGAFGAVFAGRQKFLGTGVRRVAVKVSKRTGIEEPEARELFSDAFLLAEVMDQIRDAAARSHLVHVFDMGIVREAGSRAYLVMEFVEGTDLATQFRNYRSGVPAPVLLKWMGQMCRALAALHRLERCVIHRDLKPDNVLLGGPDRHVRLVDFGLAARLLDRNYDPGVAGNYVPGVAGTTQYMAPETMQGAGKSVPASDVYSAGIMLYEGLTGFRPFEHVRPPLDMPAALQKDWLYERRRALRPRVPSYHNPTVEAYLDKLVMRCLEFEPRHRYHDAGALLEALNPPLPEPSAGSECAQLKADRKFDEARRCLERALANPVQASDERFRLLRELAEVLGEMGDHKAAARKLEDAWELADKTVILRTRRERAELLGQIERAYRLVPNGFMAERYKSKKEAELVPR